MIVTKVKDTGIGMNRRQKKRLFKAFEDIKVRAAKT